MQLSSWTELKARADRYGESVNSYDWLKFIALLLMTIDHVGAYLLDTEVEWLRALGRICVPIWLFLAGYSQSRFIMGEILLLGLVLVPLNYLSGHGIFPFNILISIIICRYILFWLKDRGLVEKRPFDIFLACLLLSLPSTFFFEYGTMGICFAVMGDMVRRKLHSTDLAVFSVLSTLLFLGYQFMWFDFSHLQNAIMIVGTCYTVWVLYHFEVKPSKWAPQTGVANYLVRFIARNTMHYYFYHRALFQLLGLLLGVSYFKPWLIFN